MIMPSPSPQPLHTHVLNYARRTAKAFRLQRSDGLRTWVCRGRGKGVGLNTRTCVQQHSYCEAIIFHRYNEGQMATKVPLSQAEKAKLQRPDGDKGFAGEKKGLRWLLQPLASSGWLPLARVSIVSIIVHVDPRSDDWAHDTNGLCILVGHNVQLEVAS